jgi:hypothetical protein
MIEHLSSEVGVAPLSGYVHHSVIYSYVFLITSAINCTAHEDVTTSDFFNFYLSRFVNNSGGYFMPSERLGFTLIYILRVTLFSSYSMSLFSQFYN